MIRVLNVMEDGRIAGPQLRMLRVAKRLAGRVDTIIAIPTRPPYEFRDALDAASVPYVQLPLTKLSRSPREIFLSLLRLPFEVNKMASYIRQQDIGVVHSSGGAWMFKAILAAKLAGCPSVWHLNDTSSPTPFRLLARWLLRHGVAGVIVAGSRVKEHYLPDYESSYSDKVYLLPIEAPVDTAAFTPRERMPVTGDQVRVLTVGNISPVKDYLTAVRASEQLKGSPDIYWRIVGSSYQSQEKYRDMLDSEVERLGLTQLEFFGPSTDIVGQLQSADIYACTSAAEASPTSVWEAMACGLPIVSTDVGCVRDYIQDGINGYLVQPGDSKGMAAKILQLANDGALRKQMGQENRRRAVESLDISVCAKRHQDIYELVAAKSVVTNSSSGG